MTEIYKDDILSKVDEEVIDIEDMNTDVRDCPKAGRDE
jgi:hypothetical protein